MQVRCKRHGFDLWIEKIPEEGKATHSSIFAWRIPWTEEPARLQSIGSQRVIHNGSDWTHMNHRTLWALTFISCHESWRVQKYQPWFASLEKVLWKTWHWRRFLNRWLRCSVPLSFVFFNQPFMTISYHVKFRKYAFLYWAHASSNLQK